jgi:integrase
VELGAIMRNPTPDLRFKIGDKLKKVLTEEQVKIFLTRAKEMDVEWYPIWVTAVYTGMRNGELFALTWDKVNLNERLILVNTSWNNKDGFKSTKSGDDRIVEIAPNLVELFKQLKLQSNGSPYVLPRVRYWDDGAQARELRMFLMGIGLPPIRFHDLRATWATLLLSKGVEPIKVMKVGGWKDMKTMMIYVRKAGVDIRGMSDVLNLHDPSLESAQVIRLERS